MVSPRIPAPSLMTEISTVSPTAAQANGLVVGRMGDCIGQEVGYKLGNACGVALDGTVDPNVSGKLAIWASQLQLLYNVKKNGREIPAARETIVRVSAQGQSRVSS